MRCYEGILCARPRSALCSRTSEIYERFAFRGVGPVSYTHLDVYKRQILFSSFKRFTTYVRFSKISTQDRLIKKI